MWLLGCGSKLPMMVGKNKQNLGSEAFLVPKPSPVSGVSWKTHLRGLDVLQREREENMRTAGQADTATSERWWECQEEDRIYFFPFTAHKMNMSARVTFGKGRLTSKQLFFAFPQTDSLRKGSRSAGGKRRMFSFSLRCRLGVIRGRTKGKIWDLIFNKIPKTSMEYPEFSLVIPTKYLHKFTSVYNLQHSLIHVHYAAGLSNINVWACLRPVKLNIRLKKILDDDS